jgi:dephospho-CoA kinase
MLVLRRVAVTGGIASGKSTVARFFQKFGAYVVSADQIVHKFLSSHSALEKQIISLLGNKILVHGFIDRKKMADVVFSDPKLLHKIEALIHPMVASEIARLWDEAAVSNHKYPLFVAEVPLLFEAEQDGWYDVTIAVVSPEEACIKRFSGGVNEYQRRQTLQFTQSQKAKKANFIIENTGSLEELEAKTASLYTLLSKGEDLDI